MASNAPSEQTIGAKPFKPVSYRSADELIRHSHRLIEKMDVSRRVEHEYERRVGKPVTSSKEDEGLRERQAQIRSEIRAAEPTLTDSEIGARVDLAFWEELKSRPYGPQSRSTPAEKAYGKFWDQQVAIYRHEEAAKAPHRASKPGEATESHQFAAIDAALSAVASVVGQVGPPARRVRSAVDADIEEALLEHRSLNTAGRVIPASIHALVQVSSAVQGALEQLSEAGLYTSAIDLEDPGYRFKDAIATLTTKASVDRAGEKDADYVARRLDSAKPILAPYLAGEEDWNRAAPFMGQSLMRAFYFSMHASYVMEAFETGARYFISKPRLALLSVPMFTANMALQSSLDALYDMRIVEDMAKTLPMRLLKRKVQPFVGAAMPTIGALWNFASGIAGAATGPAVSKGKGILDWGKALAVSLGDKGMTGANWIQSRVMRGMETTPAGTLYKMGKGLAKRALPTIGKVADVVAHEMGAIGAMLVKLISTRPDQLLTDLLKNPHIGQALQRVFHSLVNLTGLDSAELSKTVRSIVDRVSSGVGAAGGAVVGALTDLIHGVVGLAKRAPDLDPSKLITNPTLRNVAKTLVGAATAMAGAVFGNPLVALAGKGIDLLVGAGRGGLQTAGQVGLAALTKTGEFAKLFGGRALKAGDDTVKAIAKRGGQLAGIGQGVLRGVGTAAGGAFATVKKLGGAILGGVASEGRRVIKGAGSAIGFARDVAGRVLGGAIGLAKSVADQAEQLASRAFQTVSSLIPSIPIPSLPRLPAIPPLPPIPVPQMPPVVENVARTVGSYASAAEDKAKSLLGGLGIQFSRNGGPEPDTDAAAMRGELLTRGGSGQPLPGDMRSRMEGLFKQDLSGVRVHTGIPAQEKATQLQARAYTMGRDVFFAKGAYDPRSLEGQALIGHELTHVVQQAQGRVQTKRTLGGPSDPYELEAEQMSEMVMQTTFQQRGGVAVGRCDVVLQEGDQRVTPSDMTRLNAIRDSALEQVRSASVGGVHVMQLAVDIELDLDSMTDAEAATVWASAVLEELRGQSGSDAGEASSPSQAVQRMAEGIAMAEASGKPDAGSSPGEAAPGAKAATGPAVPFKRPATPEQQEFNDRFRRVRSTIDQARITAETYQEERSGGLARFTSMLGGHFANFGAPPADSYTGPAQDLLAAAAEAMRQGDAAAAEAKLAAAQQLARKVHEGIAEYNEGFFKGGDRVIGGLEVAKTAGELSAEGLAAPLGPLGQTLVGSAYSTGARAIQEATSGLIGTGTNWKGMATDAAVNTAFSFGVMGAGGKLAKWGGNKLGPFAERVLGNPAVAGAMKAAEKGASAMGKKASRAAGWVMGRAERAGLPQAAEWLGEKFESMGGRKVADKLEQWGVIETLKGAPKAILEGRAKDVGKSPLDVLVHRLTDEKEHVKGFGEETYDRAKEEAMDWRKMIVEVLHGHALSRGQGRSTGRLKSIEEGLEHSPNLKRATEESVPFGPEYQRHLSPESADAPGRTEAEKRFEGFRRESPGEGSAPSAQSGPSESPAPGAQTGAPPESQAWRGQRERQGSPSDASEPRQVELGPWSESAPAAQSASAGAARQRQIPIPKEGEVAPSSQSQVAKSAALKLAEDIERRVGRRISIHNPEDETYRHRWLELKHAEMERTGMTEGPALYEEIDRQYNRELRESATELKRTGQISGDLGNAWYVERGRQIERETTTHEQRRKGGGKAGFKPLTVGKHFDEASIEL